MNITHFAPSHRRMELLDPMCGYVAPGDCITMDSKQCNCQDCLDWIRPPSEDSSVSTVKAGLPK